MLLVDCPDQLDPWTARILNRLSGVGIVVSVGVSGAIPTLGPLTSSDLMELFEGPDHFLHLREDAASLVLERTRGVVGRVERELDAWLAGRLAQRRGGLIAVDRPTLDQIASAPPFAFWPATNAVLELDDHLRSVLSWVVLAAGAITAAQLAEATGRPEWEVEVGLDELLRLGVVGRLGESGWYALVAPPGLQRALDSDAGDVHRRLARVFPAGSEARLRQLLSAGDLAEAIGCAAAAAELALAQGRAGRALGTLVGVLGNARGPGLDAGIEVAVPLLCRGAIREGTADALRVAAHCLDRLGGEAAAEGLRLLKAEGLSSRGQHAEAMAAIAGSAAPADLDLHLATAAIELRMAVREGKEPARATLARHQRRFGAYRSARSRLATWGGIVAYAAGDYAGAAELHRLAGSLASGHEMLTARVNLVVALLDCFRPGEAAVEAERLRDDARGLRAPRMEAHGETLLMVARYRSAQPVSLDDELVAASAMVSMDMRHSNLCLTGAADAWRNGDLARAQSLARSAEAAAREARRPDLTLLPRALRTALGDTDSSSLALSGDIAVSKLPRQAVQAAGLLAAAGAWTGPIRAEWPDSVPRDFVATRLEVLSLGEAVERLG